MNTINEIHNTRVKLIFVHLFDTMHSCLTLIDSPASRERANQQLEKIYGLVMNEFDPNHLKEEREINKQIRVDEKAHLLNRLLNLISDKQLSRDEAVQLLGYEPTIDIPRKNLEAGIKTLKGLKRGA
jgi:hypothetical protein